VISEEVFAKEAEEFLNSNAPLKAPMRKFVWGEGPDTAALFDETSRDDELVQVEEAKAWRQKKYDAGYGWITGPPALGGRGLPRSFQRIYDDLESRYAVPDQGCFGIGLGMVAPTVEAHAADDVKTDMLPKLWRGEIIACQLFSEPGAGSDLASLQLRAERDGEEWILNGQKVWTSGAHYSDVGEIIARTDPDLPKHQGLTGFMVDMKAPGVEVRPLRQMTGGANFNEVYFTDARVPDEWRLGDVNQGWAVAITTLMNERASIGSGGGGGRGGAMNMTRMMAMLRHFGVADDPNIRQQVARLYAGQKTLAWTNQRAMDRMKAGQTPGAEMSMAKMALVRNMQTTDQLLADVLGPRLVADTGEWGTYSNSQFVLGLPAMRIAGGSDEVMRNIVGERVLGLPKEPGIDTTSPFRELKVGTQRAPG
jgi:acyl-CoA dehydrogenase